MRTFLSYLTLSILICGAVAQNETAPSDAPSFSSFPSVSPVLVTDAPTTAAPVTGTPTSEPTSSPVTGTPTAGPTLAPVTIAPTTLAPVTDAPTGSPVATAPPTSSTSAPTTSFPTPAPVLTSSPTSSTVAPTTAAPVTGTPTTLAPVTATPTTLAPVTGTPTTLAPVTSSPSAAPVTPTALPTSGPTPTTSRPTSATSEPTTSPTSEVVESLPGLTLTLVGVGNLDAQAQITFLSETREFYLAVYAPGEGGRRLQKVEGITNFDTTIRELSQGVSAEGNTLTYTQDVEYTTVDNASPLSVIRNPLNDQTLLDVYLNLLKASGEEAFDSLTAIDPSPPAGPGDDDDGDDGLSTGAIAGIAAGGAVLLAIGGYMLLRSRDADSHERLNGNENEPPVSFSAVQSEEVSTIDQRSTPAETGYGDQSVATVDYDYSKAYGGADTSVVSSAGGTMGENTRETGSALQTSARAALGASFDSEGKPDANVREEVIEINAPAGKLGVVIDTPDEGAPVVHAVKDSSVIADLIQVGDKLVAVDDEDVTAMTAIKVSKLISKKSANPSRKLTVIRQVLIED